MHTIRFAQVAFLLTLVLALAGAQNVERITGDDGDFEPIFPVDDYGPSWITGDSDGDGRVDYALYLDESSRKQFEAVDFNSDGLMDDFYIYRGGVLAAEHLDTNFDGTIDLWIYMHDGVRVRGYERDSDYDGTIDLVREFGES